MCPIIFQFGPVGIYSYGLMLVIAFIVATHLAKKRAKEGFFSPDLVINLSTYLLIGGLIGARVLYVVLNLEEYRKYPLQILMIQRGGLCFFGALLGGLISGLLFLKKYKLSFFKTADFAIPYVALGQAIGRIGCFLRGCCYGKETGFFIRIKFPDEFVYRHPTQIYASILNFSIFLILRHLYKNRRFEGEIFLLYLILYSLKRFFFDFLREDLPRIFLGLNLFQIFSVFLFFFSSSLFVFKMRLWKRRNSL